MSMLAKSIMTGSLLSVVASAVATAIDWFNNPGQVFRDSAGTNWLNVAETFWSWLWPLFIVALVASIVVGVALTVRKSRRSG